MNNLSPYDFEDEIYDEVDNPSSYEVALLEAEFDNRCWCYVVQSEEVPLQSDIAWCHKKQAH